MSEDRGFNSKIRIKFPKSYGGKDTTFYRPYVYDIGAPKQGSDFSDDFKKDAPLVHPNNGGLRHLQANYNDIKETASNLNIHSRFLCCKGTNGYRGVFSAINEKMSNLDNFKEINEAIVEMPFSMYVDNKTFINKKNIKLDRGTLKYRDSDGIVYTAVGVRSLGSLNELLRFWDSLPIYGSPFKFSNNFARNTTFALNDYNTDFFANDTYSSFMLVLKMHIWIANNNRQSDKYSFCSFLPINMYDLSLLNNKNTNPQWYVVAARGANSPFDFSFYITNQAKALSSSDAVSERMYGYNYNNIARGLLRDRASAIAVNDVIWKTPDTGIGTQNFIIPSSTMVVFNSETASAGPVRYNIDLDITSYYMSERSYRYYMYGDGLSLWRTASNTAQAVNPLDVNSLQNAQFKVKWYPYDKTRNANEVLYKNGYIL